MKKNVLKENMKRFATKNLKEQDVITKMTDFGAIDTPNTGKYLKRDITDVKPGEVYVVIPFYSDGITINENDVRVFTSYGKADNYFNTLQGSPIIVNTSID